MDNGIVILVTKDEEGDPEYRVAYLDQVDSIYGLWDDDTENWEPDTEIILDTFTESDIYTELERAFDCAQDLSADKPYLDNGIMVVTDFKDLVFNNI